MMAKALGPGNTSEWTVKGATLSFEHGPLVMGILNVTPDSFSDGGKNSDPDAAVLHAKRLISEGAHILDIGGESARPGATPVDEATEMRRVVPVIKAVRGFSDVPISVDTTKAVVAEAALAAGASIINDISGLSFDTEMANAVAGANAGLVLMHLTGDFETMHRAADPGVDIVEEVIDGLGRSLAQALKSGIERSRICLDVGIGFGKTLKQNVQLLARLDDVKKAFPGMGMLVGVSRKTFIGKLTGQSEPGERLAGTIAANCAAVCRGADVLRVHDVKPAIEAVKVLNAIRYAYEDR